jgi:hypothetical protein
MSQPSFWDRNPQFAHQLPPYLGEEEKRQLVEAGVPFTIVQVIAEPNAAYQGKPTPRWSLVIDTMFFVIDDDDATQRTMTFPMNPTRDAMLSSMKEWLDASNPGVPCVLGWYVPASGSGFYTLNPAPQSAPEIAPRKLDESGDRSK